MKALFLDVDGVLNSSETRREHGWRFIPEVNVRRVGAVVRYTGAEIVLSSSWRENEDLRNALRVEFRRLLKIDIRHRTICLKPGFNVDKRADEIRAWIKEHKPEKWAVLDDFEDADLGDGSFFQTDDRVGLTDEICDSVMKHLGVSSE